MGTPFVSGCKKYEKAVMMISNEAKNKKIPHSILHSIGKNVWVVKNVPKKLKNTDVVAPADRVSKL